MTERRRLASSSCGCLLDDDEEPCYRCNQCEMCCECDDVFDADELGLDPETDNEPEHEERTSA